jgi:hypothetical protein
MAYDDEYDEQGDQSGSELRKQLEKALKANKELAAKVEAFEAAEQAKVARESLETILKDKGVKPGLVKWLEKDGVEPSKDAVDKWLSENGEFFNVTADGKTETKTDSSEQGETNGQEQHEAQSQSADPFADLPPELRAAFEAMAAGQALESEAVSVQVDPKAEGVVQRGLEVVGESAKTEADILSALVKLGAPVKTGY